MKEYMKPTAEIVDIKVKDDIASGSVYTVNGDTITYYVMKNGSVQ